MKYYNVIVLRNGVKDTVNSRPLKEMEAEEIYRQYKKSGIIFEDIEIQEIK